MLTAIVAPTMKTAATESSTMIATRHQTRQQPVHRPIAATANAKRAKSAALTRTAITTTASSTTESNHGTYRHDDVVTTIGDDNIHSTHVYESSSSRINNDARDRTSTATATGTPTNSRNSYCHTGQDRCIHQNCNGHHGLKYDRGSNHGADHHNDAAKQCRDESSQVLVEAVLAVWLILELTWSRRNDLLFSNVKTNNRVMATMLRTGFRDSSAPICTPPLCSTHVIVAL